MSKKKFVYLVTAIALISLITACGNTSTPAAAGSSSTTSASDSKATSSSAAQEVNVVASNFKWELSKTTFKKGEIVTFVIQGKEGMHGFAIEGTDVNQKIAAGETKKVTWTPNKTGEFTIKCSVMCGTGHNDMLQKITVN